MRDYATGEWSQALCSACGVDPAQFPRFWKLTKFRENHRGGRRSYRLRVGTPVMAGTVDSASAALEVGVVEPGIAAEMTGTSTVVIIPNDSGLTEPALIAMPHACRTPPAARAMVSSGGCLRWFRDQLGQAEVQAAKELGADAFDLLTEQAAQVPLGSDGVIFLPYMMGERSPLWHTMRAGCSSASRWRRARRH